MLSRLTRYTTRLIIALALCCSADAQSTLRDQTLRDAARSAGVKPLGEINPPVDPAQAAIGARLFESTLLSFNADTSCQTCHIDRFGSADGLPNAIGTGGRGEGAARFAQGGDIVPRNTLPFWGRGSRGFDTFFWDGKVRKTQHGVVSQFLDAPPSSDPLAVAVHLPFVEIRELVVRDARVTGEYQQEDVASANRIYAELIRRIRADAALGPPLARAFDVDVADLAFGHVADAIAAFIRDKFAVRRTAFHAFVYDGGRLSEPAVRGGLLFYGKGRCSSCHSGTLMSDLSFHVMPFPQAGFGRNGFGVDYGRYNVTRNPADLYAFRTPPLINVTRTAPYTHSGSVTDLETMIRLHVDPLSGYNGSTRTIAQRREDLARLLAWQGGAPPPEPLSDGEIRELVAFLKALETD